MERKPHTVMQRILSQCFAAIRSNHNHDEDWLNEDRADRELVSYTQKAMRETLAHARQKGRRGWWRKSECTIEHLESLLQSAIDKGDMIDIINYAAMIEIRRITDE